jgi:elongation factor Ts
MEAESKGKPKPADIIEKIVAGKVNKRLSEVCLLGQQHMAAEGSPVIGKYIETLSKDLGVSVSVSGFELWSLGSGQPAEASDA